MGKATKGILWAAGFCLVFGLVLALVGASNGGLRALTVDWFDGLRVSGLRGQDQVDYDVEFPDGVEDLRVRADGCSLRFVQGSVLKVKCSYDDSLWDLDVRLEEGRLSVRLSPQSSLDLIGFGLVGRPFPELVITCPKSLELGALEIEGDALDLEAGDLLFAREVSIRLRASSLAMEGLECEGLELSADACSVDLGALKVAGKAVIRTDAGGVELRRLECEGLELTAKAGSVLVERLLVSGTASVRINAGSIELSHADVANLSLDMSMGSLSYSGTLLGDNTIDVDAGTADFDLAQPERDLAFSYEVHAGEASVNGVSRGGDGPGGGPAEGRAHLLLKVDMGTVRIHTR